MAEIEITITADEDDLRNVGGPWHLITNVATARVNKAIAAALPKPRLVVRPGMVLRRNSDRVRWFICADGLTTDLWMQAPYPTTNRYVPTEGLDPAEWELILPAEPS